MTYAARQVPSESEPRLTGQLRKDRRDLVGPAEQPDPTPSISSPLRREAEKKWAESDRSDAKRDERGRAKTRARTERRLTAGRQRDEIAGLTESLKQAKRELAQQRRHQGKGGGK